MNKQHGSALLSALFIMTLVAIATTTLTLQLKTSIEQTRLVASTTQFQREFIAIRYWAMDALTHKKTKHLGRKPGETTLKTSRIRINGLPHIEFSSELIDLNARLNLNNLTNSNTKTTFYQLAQHLLEEKVGKKSYPLTQAISQWVKAYKPGDAEDSNTLYAHLPMVSLSELKSIPKVDPKLIEPFMPYITALPPPTKININTVSEEVLMAMAKKDADTVKHMDDLISIRGEDGLVSLAPIKDLLRKLQIDPKLLITESEYFLNVGHAKTKTQQITLYSLLRRVKNNDKSYSVYLVQETWNTD